MYQYYLVLGLTRIFLFESQFQLRTEEASLCHYEKGLTKGLFTLDRAKIDQIWSELGLWGLIGRINPVELVRILCAFGCSLKVGGLRTSTSLTKSYFPVTYFIPVLPCNQNCIEHLYNISLDPNSEKCIPIFLELYDRLVIGSYYTTSKQDIDTQMPKFCEIMERDICLPENTIRDVLFDFLQEGYKISAQDHGQCIDLAQWNTFTDTLRGHANDNALFYMGSASKSRKAV